MHPIVRDKVKMLTDQIKAIKKTSKDVYFVRKILPDSIIWVDHEVNVNWNANDMSEVKTALAKFAKAGALLDEFVASDTSPVWYLQGKDVRIRLCPLWNMDANSACKLVKVGEELVHHTRPIYKLVCGDNHESQISG